jgi:hypothetical protein
MTHPIEKGTGGGGLKTAKNCHAVFQVQTAPEASKK